MVKKYMPGVMAALIVLISLLGSGGQAFAAATGGASLSKWVYAETDELYDADGSGLGSSQSLGIFPQADVWKDVDTILNANVIASSTYDYWHVFDRRTYYSTSGTPLKATDFHYFLRTLKSNNATFVRQDGRIYFKNQTTTYLVSYERLIYSYKDSLRSEWTSYTPPTQGLVALNVGTVGDITIAEKMVPGVYYDPNKPPGYAQPGNTSPSSGNTIPDPTVIDPDFPVQPTPPDSNWDLIGWIKYIVDWLIYLVKCFVYFLKSFGTAIADVVNGSASLISAMTDFFAFLPNQITTIIGMGLVAMIIVGIVKR